MTVKGALMFAVFIEVNADESVIDEARERLATTAAPRAREAGAKAGYWLAPQNGRGIAVMVYESEDEARRATADFKVGDEPPGAPAGVTFKTIEIREVLANL